MMKDMLTPAGTDDVRATIKHCLEESALLNYNNIVHAACALLRLSSPPADCSHSISATSVLFGPTALIGLAPPLSVQSRPLLLSSLLCFALNRFALDALHLYLQSFNVPETQCRARAVRRRPEVRIGDADADILLLLTLFSRQIRCVPLQSAV